MVKTQCSLRALREISEGTTEIPRKLGMTALGRMTEPESRRCLGLCVENSGRGWRHRAQRWHTRAEDVCLRADSVVCEVFLLLLLRFCLSPVFVRVLLPLELQRTNVEHHHGLSARRLDVQPNRKDPLRTK